MNLLHFIERWGNESFHFVLLSRHVGFSYPLLIYKLKFTCNRKKRGM